MFLAHSSNPGFPRICPIFPKGLGFPANCPRFSQHSSPHSIQFIQSFLISWTKILTKNLTRAFKVNSPHPNHYTNPTKNYFAFKNQTNGLHTSQKCPRFLFKIEKRKIQNLFNSPIDKKITFQKKNNIFLKFPWLLYF